MNIMVVSSPEQTHGGVEDPLWLHKCSELHFDEFPRRDLTHLFARRWSDLMKAMRGQ
jgi:hypothetical protein